MDRDCPTFKTTNTNGCKDFEQGTGLFPRTLYSFYYYFFFLFLKFVEAKLCHPVLKYFNIPPIKRFERTGKHMYPVKRTGLTLSKNLRLEAIVNPSNI